MTTYDRNYAKPNADGTPAFGPMPLFIDIPRHEEWDEPVLDPETGEPTGETEHRERDWIDRKTFIRPAATDFNLAGYLLLVDRPPSTPPSEGMRWAKTGRIVPADGRYAWEYAQEALPAPPPRTFSKLRMVQALMAANLWPQVKAWIEAAGLYDLYLAAQTFREDDPHFAPALTTLKQSLGVTDEAVEEVLAAAVID